jgi:hypothetical protein
MRRTRALRGRDGGDRGTNDRTRERVNVQDQFGTRRIEVRDMPSRLCAPSTRPDGPAPTPGGPTPTPVATPTPDGEPTPTPDGEPTPTPIVGSPAGAFLDGLSGF